MLIASLSLVAFPFMTGFYSKDLIIESAFGKFNLSSVIVYFISSIGAMFTTLYSIKVLYITFLSNPNGPLVNYKHSSSKSAHEGDIFISMPLIILSVFSIYFGYINKDIFIGLGSDFFSDNALFIHPHNEIMISTEFFVPIIFKLLPLIFTLSLTAISILSTEFYQKYIIGFKYSVLGYNIFSFLNQRFAVELIYNKYISAIILYLGGQSNKDMDKGIVDTFGPYGLQKKLISISEFLDKLNTGIVTSYALYILISLLFIINVMYFSEEVNINDMLILIFLLLVVFPHTVKLGKRKRNTPGIWIGIKRVVNKIVNAYNYVYGVIIYRIILFYQDNIQVITLGYWIVWISIRLLAIEWILIMQEINEGIKLGTEVIKQGSVLYMEAGESSNSNIDKGKGRDEFAPPKGGWPTARDSIVSRSLPSDSIPNATEANRGSAISPILIDAEATLLDKGKAPIPNIAGSNRGSAVLPILIDDEATLPDKGKGPMPQQAMSSIGTSGNSVSVSNLVNKIVTSSNSSLNASNTTSDTVTPSSSNINIPSAASGTIAPSSSNVNIPPATSGTIAPSSINVGPVTGISGSLKIPEGLSREYWINKDHPLTARPHPDLPLVVKQHLPFQSRHSYDNIYRHFDIADEDRRDSRIIQSIQANNFARSDDFMEEFWKSMNEIWSNGLKVQKMIDERKYFSERHYNSQLTNFTFTARENTLNQMISVDMQNETAVLEKLHAEFSTAHSKLGVIYYHQAKYDNDLNARVDVKLLKQQSDWRSLQEHELQKIAEHTRQQENLACQLKKDPNFVDKVFNGHKGETYIDNALKRKLNDDIRAAAGRPKKIFNYDD
jgi:NADH-ubiquinone oxidoreductase chain 5